MRKLRATAETEDMPVSEVIRRATELWLDRFPAKPGLKVKAVPVVRLGKCKVAPEDLRDKIYE